MIDEKTIMKEIENEPNLRTEIEKTKQALKLMMAAIDLFERCDPSGYTDDELRELLHMTAVDIEEAMRSYRRIPLKTENVRRRYEKYVQKLRKVQEWYTEDEWARPREWKPCTDLGNG